MTLIVQIFQENNGKKAVDKKEGIWLFWQVVISAIACAVSFYIDIRAGQITTALSLLLILIYYISP